MTSNVIQQADHKLYRNEIDALYSITAESCAEMFQIMQMKNGSVSRAHFSEFYKNFKNLFLQTSKSKHMDEEGQLIEEIWDWMDYTHPINEKRATAGERLFWEWGKALEKRGIHTIST